MVIITRGSRFSEAGRQAGKQAGSQSALIAVSEASRRRPTTYVNMYLTSYSQLFLRVLASRRNPRASC